MTSDGPVRAGTIATERLLLRPVQATDAQALFTIRSDPEVTVRYGQEPHRTVEQTAAWLARCVAELERGGDMVWAVALRGSGEVIGECCLWNFDSGRRCAELGYELHPTYWRQGLMTEALSAILTWGFSELGLHRIEATPLASHEASCGILLKLGFKHEGTLRQRVFFRGRFEDQRYFGLLSEEWRGRADGDRR